MGRLVVALVAGICIAQLAGFSRAQPDAMVDPGGGAGAFATIQSAVDAVANPTDPAEIWVVTGQYNESITLQSGVAVYGGFSSGATSFGDRDPVANPTVVTASGLGPVRCVTAVGVSQTRLDGLTFRDGVSTGTREAGRGGGVYFLDSGPGNVIENCAFLSNLAEAGGGLACEDSPLTVIDCLFRSNESTRNGGAGALVKHTTAEFAGCEFTENRCSSMADGKGGGLLCEDRTAFVLVTDCVFRGNAASVAGGGALSIFNRANATVEDSVLEANTTRGNGGAIRTFAQNQLRFTRCRINGNRSGLAGAGADINTRANVLFDQCEIRGNRSGNSSGGVMVSTGGMAEFRNCLISGNKSLLAGGAVSAVNTDTVTTFTHCAFVGNRATSTLGVSGLRVDGRSWLSNTLFAAHPVPAVDQTTTAATVSLGHCLFHGNPAGDFYNRGLDELSSGATQIMANVPGATGIRDGDPMYASPIVTGTWMNASTSDEVSALTATGQPFAGMDLVGRLIRPAVAQNLDEYLILSHTDSQVVVANRADDATTGGAFDVPDFHLTVGSDAVDRGLHVGVMLDLDGQLRPSGAGFDIGPYELQVGPYDYAQAILQWLLRAEQDWPSPPEALDRNGDGAITAGDLIEALRNP